MTAEQKKLIVATQNAGKIREFRAILEPYGYLIIPAAELGCTQQAEETGTTFEANAILKAQAVTQKYHVACVADDSGLEIDAFGKAPGVYSARYLGRDTPYDIKNQIILDRMKGQTNRSCRYVCVIALSRPNQDPITFRGECEGQISLAPAGHNGFGYDPIIFYPPQNLTMAQLPPDVKNRISHRGKALRLLEEYIHEAG